MDNILNLKSLGHLLLALAAIIYTPTAQAADTGEVTNGVCYELVKGEAMVCPLPNGAKYSGNVAIGSTCSIGGRTYTVKGISAWAFHDCPELTSVTVPGNITQVLPGAFSDCPRLTTINLPSSVTHLDPAAFSGATNLTKININSSQYKSDNGVLYNGDKTVLLRCPEGKSGNVTLASSTTEIAVMAFANCTRVTSVTLNNGLQTIREQAFAGCTSLQVPTIHDNIRLVADGAFNGCTAFPNRPMLTQPDGKVLVYCPPSYSGAYTVPASVERIGEHAFEGCSLLSTINVQHNVRTIEANAFCHCTGATAINLTADLLNIADHAFEMCEQLHVVNIACNTKGTHSNCDILKQQVEAQLALSHIEADVKIQHQKYIEWTPRTEVVGGESPQFSAIVWDGIGDSGDPVNYSVPTSYKFTAGNRPTTVQITASSGNLTPVKHTFTVAAKGDVVITWNPSATTVNGHTKPDLSAEATDGLPIIYKLNGQVIGPDYELPAAQDVEKKYVIEASTAADAAHNAASTTRTFTIKPLEKVNINWYPNQRGTQEVLEGDYLSFDATADHYKTGFITYTLTKPDGSKEEIKYPWAFPAATTRDQVFSITASTPEDLFCAAASETRSFVVKALTPVSLTWEPGPTTIVGGTPIPMNATASPSREVTYWVGTVQLPAGECFPQADFNQDNEITITAKALGDKTHATAQKSVTFKLKKLVVVTINWNPSLVVLGGETLPLNGHTYDDGRQSDIIPITYHIEGTVGGAKYPAYTYEGGREIDGTFHVPEALKDVEQTITVTAMTTATPTHRQADPVTKTFTIHALKKVHISWLDTQSGTANKKCNESTQQRATIDLNGRVVYDSSNDSREVGNTVSDRPITYHLTSQQLGLDLDLTGSSYTVPAAIPDHDIDLTITATTEADQTREEAAPVTRSFTVPMLIKQRIVWYDTQGDAPTTVEPVATTVQLNAYSTPKSFAVSYTLNGLRQTANYKIPAADDDAHTYTFVASTQANCLYEAAQATRIFTVDPLIHPTISWSPATTVVGGSAPDLNSASATKGRIVKFTLNGAQLKSGYTFPVATDQDQYVTITAITEATNYHAAAPPVPVQFKIPKLVTPTITWCGSTSDAQTQEVKGGTTVPQDATSTAVANNELTYTKPSNLNTFTLPAATSVDQTFTFKVTSPKTAKCYAKTVTRTFTVGKIATISRNDIPTSANGNSTITLNATETYGRTVTYSLTQANGATLSGNTLTLPWADASSDVTVKVKATVADDNKHTTPSETFSIIVNKATTGNLTSLAIPTTVNGGSSTTLPSTVSTTDTRSVTYSLVTPSVATLSGRTLTMPWADGSPHTVSIKASVTKDATHAAETKSFNITLPAAKPVSITWNATDGTVSTPGTIQLGATAKDNNNNSATVKYTVKLDNGAEQNFTGSSYSYAPKVDEVQKITIKAYTEATATQAAATPITKTWTVRATPTITLAGYKTSDLGSNSTNSSTTITLNGTSSSGATVKFSVKIGSTTTTVTNGGSFQTPSKSSRDQTFTVTATCLATDTYTAGTATYNFDIPQNRGLEVESDDEPDMGIYDINGNKLANPQKGKLYIQNGKLIGVR